MIWTLIPVSVIYGLLAALLFRRFSDEPSIRVTTNRMMAHVLEFRLFLDSPTLVWRAQRDLFRENLRLLRLILLPCAILALTFIILFPQLDAMYGHAPLTIGVPSVVTAPLDEVAVLQAPAGISVETPAIRDIHDHEVSWRVRPLGRAAGDLQIRSHGRLLTKQIVAGGGLINGFTSQKIRILYPPTAILGVNWMIWFFLLSSAAAIGYRQ